MNLELFDDTLRGRLRRRRKWRRDGDPRRRDADQQKLNTTRSSVVVESRPIVTEFIGIGG